MSDKADKLLGTIGKKDQADFAEYASLNRKGREDVRASAFERPDLHMMQQAEQRLDAANEVLKVQVALIDSLRRKEALLVSFSQHVARACLQAASDEHPDIDAEIALSAITHNVLELQNATESKPH